MRFIACAILALGGVAAAAASVCSCAEAERSGGWCSACDVGYVGSLRLTSKLLYDEVDAHGHDFDPAKLSCETCRAALASDGYCERHRRGFVAGRAYVTFLAYHLAQGGRVEPAELGCTACRQNARSFGWCQACGQGMIGHVAVKDREVYERLAVDYEILIRANERSATCESCAAAMVLDGTCGRCNVSYRGGKPAPSQPVKP